MRKVFWCCAAAAVVAASAFYLAADYTCRRPESMFGRCVLAVCQVSAEFNPITRISHGILLQAHGTVKAVLAAVQPSQPSKAPCCSAPPKHIVQAEAKADCGTAPPAGAWDADAMAEGQMLGRITIPGEDEIRRALNPIRDAPLGGGEEAEFVPPMARVVDDVEGPGVMEPVKDFDGCEEESAAPPQAEACEPIEMPVYPHDYHHYRCPQSSGCCPYSGKCPSCEPCPSSSCPKTPVTGEEASEPKEKPAKLKKKARNVATPPGCSCPKTDTMEFRRTDGTPGQFEKIPY